ncbi:MAG: hypothetical protein EXR62_17485 [Chloroflexi bacterium]|nr:hypothetical protein [Chloroflexota bacterium]
MFRGRFIMGILAIFLIFGLFSSIGGGMQRDAWTQGYLVGRLSTSTEGSSAVPPAPVLIPGYQGFAGFHGASWGAHFGGFGLLLGIGFFFLVLMGLGKFFRFFAWRHMGGPQGGPWGRYESWPPGWGWHHQSPPGPKPQQGGPEGWQSGRQGSPPPWWGWEQRPESKPEQGEQGYRRGGGCGYM